MGKSHLDWETFKALATFTSFGLTILSSEEWHKI